MAASGLTLNRVILRVVELLNAGGRRPVRRFAILTIAPLYFQEL